ncbi:hypothetical protein ACJX0J_009702, partial [Zea mays]
MNYFIIHGLFGVRLIAVRVIHVLYKQSHEERVVENPNTPSLDLDPHIAKSKRKIQIEDLNGFEEENIDDNYDSDTTASSDFDSNYDYDPNDDIIDEKEGLRIFSLFHMTLMIHAL